MPKLNKKIERLARVLCKATGDHPDRIALGAGQRLQVGESRPAWVLYIDRAIALMMEAGEIAKEEGNEEVRKFFTEFSKHAFLNGDPRDKP